MNISSQIIFLSLAINLSIASIENNDTHNDSLIKKVSFIPGAGQFYNGKYLKSAFFGLSQLYFLSKFSSITNVAARNNHAWAALIIYILNVIDAHVDLELSSFPKENDLIESGAD